MNQQVRPETGSVVGADSFSPETGEPHNTIPENYAWLARKLAVGGFGVVYEAELFSIRRRVVMKVVSLRQYHKNDLWMARAEVEALQRIRGGYYCPYLVQQPWDFHNSEVVHWCQESTSIYMLFEQCLYDLKTFQSLCTSSNQIPSCHIWTIASHVVAGLKHLHMLGIIHRDIKRENILVDEFGLCKISDFGTSIVVRAQNLKGRNIRVNFAGPVTEPYSAPEVSISSISSEPICTFNENIDIWSLGMMLFELGASVDYLSVYTPLLDMEKFGSMREAILRIMLIRHEIKFDTGLQDFIENCLILEPELRLDAEGAMGIIRRYVTYVNLPVLVSKARELPSELEFDGELPDPGSAFRDNLKVAGVSLQERRKPQLVECNSFAIPA